MLRKIKKLWTIIKYFFEDEDNLLLHLMEMKAYETLDDCVTLEVGMTEEIEDLIFHIQTYYDIPEMIAATSYPDLPQTNVSKILKEYKSGNIDVVNMAVMADFIEEVEKQRAVERDLIFEEAKILSFGFKV